MVHQLSLCLILCCIGRILAGTVGYNGLVTMDGIQFETYFKTASSLKNWNTVDTPKSAGWNRTQQSAFSNNPVACNVRFVGVALEAVLEGFQTGGTGYMTLGYTNALKREFWNGFDKNETNKIHCYYKTTKDTGSEFIDTPKNLGLAIVCPISLDDEIGQFDHRKSIEQGFYCRPLSEYPTEISVHLRPSAYRIDPATDNQTTIAQAAAAIAPLEISAEMKSNPAEHRSMELKALSVADYRPHAVCTVQTFKNAQSGAMLYMFIAFYQLMGWRVIVYDRFGMHQREVQDLLKLPGVDYYPFTVYQLTQPTKYNKAYYLAQDNGYKSFYKMEANWGYTSKKIADTADQDADKARTYDYARLEYAHQHMILYIDADELFYCPQARDGVQHQRAFQHRIMSQFHSRGVEEMRFVRIPYSGLATPGYVNSAANRSNVDFTNHTGNCMNAAVKAKSLLDMAKCWSSGTSYDNFPKSADFAGVCPFHYNHWSCDGMRGGGRDFTKNRCRCKVSLDMQNNYDFRPMLKKCHLVHLNDNKYRFQSKRTKHEFDKGDVTVRSPLVKLLSAK